VREVRPAGRWLIVGCAALLWRQWLLDRPVAPRGAVASVVALIAVRVAVIAATTAVMTPAGPVPKGQRGWHPDRR
jgi:hypothetical protein